MSLIGTRSTSSTRSRCGCGPETECCDAVSAVTVFPQISRAFARVGSDASAFDGAIGRFQKSARYSSTRADCSPDPPSSVTLARKVNASANESAPIANVFPPIARDAFQTVTGVVAKNASQTASHGVECPGQTRTLGKTIPSVPRKKSASSSRVRGRGIASFGPVSCSAGFSGSGFHRRSVSSTSKSLKLGLDIALDRAED